MNGTLCEPWLRARDDHGREAHGHEPFCDDEQLCGDPLPRELYEPHDGGEQLLHGALQHGGDDRAWTLISLPMVTAIALSYYIDNQI